MYTPEALLDVHERSHRNLSQLLEHCRQLGDDEANRKLDGFGDSTVRLQFHHVIGAEKYWIGVLQGEMLVDESEDEYPTIESLERYREAVFDSTERYLRGASTDELNTPRKMVTWGNKERTLIPAHVFMRTLTHIHHHQGQIMVMCRLLGTPAKGVDFPIV